MPPMLKNIMTNFLFITANDIHICDINPRSRIDDFKETILDKLNQIRVICEKQKADAFIIAGDLFNLKNPNKNTHNLVRELIELFKKFKCPVYMIPGNHDLTGDNLESLKNQPLGVLFSSEAVHYLNTERSVKITKKGCSVSLVGVPFKDNLDISSITLPPKDTSIAQICAMHIYAGPESGNVFKERLYGYGELLPLDADIFVLGHYHIDQGVQTVGDKHFINLGSISRGSLAEENLEHRPKIGVIKISWDGVSAVTQVESVPLQIKPAEEVFDLKKRENEKKELVEIQKFVESLIIGTSKSTSKANEVQEIVDTMDITKAVKDKVLYFIHEAASR